MQLNGDHTFGLRQQKYKVSDQLKTGEATALFGKMRQPPRLGRLVVNRLGKLSDYLADSVDAFLTSSESPDAPEGEDLPLGLTFSFPVEQTALDSGHLLTWTKGMFRIPISHNLPLITINHFRFLRKEHCWTRCRKTPPGRL